LQSIEEFFWGPSLMIFDVVYGLLRFRPHLIHLSLQVQSLEE